jgi:hypothetical protein
MVSNRAHLGTTFLENSTTYSRFPILFPLGWASSDVSKFENMLRNVYLPEIIGGSQSNGNWELGKLSL